MSKTKTKTGMANPRAGVTGGGEGRTTRPQRRATLSFAQKDLLDSVQGQEGSTQRTSVIQDLSDEYGYKPGKRAGAKGGMGKGKRAKPRGMKNGGTTGMANPRAGVNNREMPQQEAPVQGPPTVSRQPAILAATAGGGAGKRAPVGRSGPNTAKVAAGKKAAAAKKASARRSGGSKPRGMNTGGAVGSKPRGKKNGAAVRGAGCEIRG